jgi:methylphosphotriester-DNA--protein-cysteine methyltransferase
MLGTIERLRLTEGDSGCMYLKRIAGGFYGKTSTVRRGLRTSRTSWEMSASDFHYHFRALIAMSPLQFQKQLRLQQARRLMLGEGLDAASAGYRVGYDDASHFTREYKRLFGEPRMRDVEQLGTA